MRVLTDPDNWLELPPGLKRSVIQLISKYQLINKPKHK